MLSLFVSAALVLSFSACVSSGMETAGTNVPSSSSGYTNGGHLEFHRLQSDGEKYSEK